MSKLKLLIVVLVLSLLFIAAHVAEQNKLSKKLCQNLGYNYYFKAQYKDGMCIAEEPIE